VGVGRRFSLEELEFSHPGLGETGGELREGLSESNLRFQPGRLAERFRHFECRRVSESAELMTPRARRFNVGEGLLLR